MTMKNQPSKTKQIQVSRQLLNKQRLFQHFSDTEFDQIIPVLKFLQLKRGHIIIKQGQQSDGIYILLKGQLQVYSVNNEHRETGFSYILEGDFFGEMSVIDNTPSMVDVKATKDSILISIPHDICIQLMEKKYQFTFEVLKKLTRTLRGFNDRFIMLHLRSEERLMHFMNAVANKSDNEFIYGPMSKHEEISAMTNLSRETITRHLSKLKKQGCLTTFKTDFGNEFKIRKKCLLLDT